MTRFVPERSTVRLRNGTVTAATSTSITLAMDGFTTAGVPVHGPMPGVGAVVLVLEQDTSLLVLGDAVTAIRNLQDEIKALKAQIGGHHGGNS